MKMELGNFLGIHMCEREMRGGELHFLLQYKHGLSFNFFSFLPSSFSSLFVSFLFLLLERERGRDESGVSVKRERERVSSGGWKALFRANMWDQGRGRETAHPFARGLLWNGGT